MDNTQELKCPIAIELPIPENLLKESKDTQNAIYSEWYDASNIPGIRYCIILFQNEPDHKGETWIEFLIENKNKIKVGADFKMTIKSANYNSEKNVVLEQTDLEEQKLCTTDELFDPEKRFIVDGKMVLRMDGFLMIEQEEKNDIKLKCDNFDSLLCLALWEQESKDFAVIVGGKSITAHKNVLAARSPVFAKMFESGMKETKENKVVITDFPFEIVEKAIKLCYHRSLVPYATLEEKMKLLQFFDKYDIKPLKDSFEKYLISVINELTVCRLTNAALLSNGLKLEMKCLEFLRDCLKKTKPISDFDLLDKEFALNFLKNSFCPISECEYA